ncbi:hypothetical protein H261_11869 [Paramagnetospirillum caucaseum]|uniref:Uncharacterized protein n=1 Tax=Paramagnetospirillum caucaseum TaxID=1244869 RepID=M2Z5Y5_9PROT|nr:hypothetical protein [Paramagnetospirillum caucaseum]EME69730.1 hypothetical protein H261_11869 [Paramagnetospirillum caucaseum]
MSDTADEAQAREERFRAESLVRAGIKPRPLVIPPPHYADDTALADADGHVLDKEGR